MSVVAFTSDDGVGREEDSMNTALSGALCSPLYIAWQVTNECNLACLHCIEESGPGKAFSDELSDNEVFEVLRQIAELGVPYLSFSGGEPMLHPRFFDMVDYACTHGIELKIETNGHYLDPKNCERLKELGVKAVQVSLDGATAQSFQRMRVRGDFDRMVDGVRNLHKAGVPIEINYSPSQFSIDDAAKVVDLAYELGAFSFYSGRTMYTGNAVKTWRKMTPSEEQYSTLFDTLSRKADEYTGRMAIRYHEMGLLEELRYRQQNPAALLIILPNGLVKLINALPFVCGDLRQQSLAMVWKNFQHAWEDPRVTQFIEDLDRDPATTSQLHQWIHL